MDAWINVRDQQPEKHEWVLFIARSFGDWEHYNNKVFAGRFQEYSEKYGGEFSMPGIGIEGTHWLPLSILPPIPNNKFKLTPPEGVAT
jgi:hypothetical protein